MCSQDFNVSVKGEILCFGLIAAVTVTTVDGYTKFY